MFANPVLDALSRVHPCVPPLLYLPVIGLALFSAIDRLGPARAAVALGAGYVAWTLCEYWLHRVVFHFEPADGLGARLHWIIHGVHHEHPNDPMRLVMPPSVSLPLAALFFGGFVLALGLSWGIGVTAGFLAGYLVYDMLHYHAHHHVPKSRLGRRLRELHMRHHFQDDTTMFGVSAPYWDHVFGTASKQSRRRAARGD